jgi:tetratricopeptide (TPR) repeat protein
MSVRVARVLIVMAACLTCLGGCSSATKLSDLWTPKSSDTPDAPAADVGGTKLSDLWTPKTDSSNAPAANADGFKLSDLWAPKKSDVSDAPAGNPTETTGSVDVQPAEAGPGALVAPLAKPGLLGDDPHDDLQLAKKYFRTNNYGLAEKSFRSAVEKHPRDAEAWVGLAASYDRLHRFDLADRAYQEAIRIIGPTVEILNNQGFSYMLRGDYTRAHKKLQEAEAKDPANPYVAANLRLLEESYREGKSIQ